MHSLVADVMQYLTLESANARPIGDESLARLTAYLGPLVLDEGTPRPHVTSSCLFLFSPDHVQALRRRLPAIRLIAAVEMPDHNVLVHAFQWAGSSELEQILHYHSPEALA